MLVSTQTTVLRSCRRILQSALLLLALALSFHAQNDPLGTWSGTVDRDGRSWRVSVRLARDGEGYKASIDFPDADGYDREFAVTISPDGMIEMKRPQPSGIPITFKGRVGESVFSGEWSGFGQTATFTMKRSLRRVFPEREVSFTNGTVTLSGTLILPQKAGRFPAVVITHGGTPHERAGYRGWAMHFVRSGVAALIYDKRGAGKSAGETRSASMEDLAADAVAGVDLLRTLPEIDSKKIGVAGHSQGGWIAPLASTISPHVAFVIASAASGVSPDKQSIYHRASVMREAGFSADAIKTASDLRQRLYVTGRMILDNDPRAAEERRKMSIELERYAKEPWLEAAALPPNLNDDRPTTGGLRLLFFEPVPMWEKVKVPVLLVWGDRDTVVPVDEGRAIIEAALRRARNGRVTTKVFPNVDHGVVKIRQEPGWDFPRVELAYYETIVEWTKSIVAGRN